MTPAHSGALAPLRKIQARDSVLPGREKDALSQNVEGRLGDPDDRALTEPESLEQLGPLGRVEPGCLGLELDRDGEDVRGTPEVLFHRGHELVGAGELVLPDVDDGHRGFCGEEEEGSKRLKVGRVEP